MSEKTLITNAARRKHEEQRRQLWVDVCSMVTKSNNGLYRHDGPNWADEALKRFDKKFPGPIALPRAYIMGVDQ